MRCEIQLAERLVGYAAESPRGPGEVTIVCSEFVSSEDGLHFLSRVEGLQQTIIRHVPSCPPPSQIDTFLAIIGQDLKTTVLVNEVGAIGTVTPKRDFKKGELILFDDIADIVNVDLGIPIPDDSGFAYIDSFGWRKSLFFDFTPLLRPEKRRTYDLGRTLGEQRAYLLFQDTLRITEVQWTTLFEQGWFPFRMLPISAVKTMLSQANETWDIATEILTPALLLQLKAIADPQSRLLRSAEFDAHRAIIAHAFDRFRADDWKSVVALLFPRIEGILRSLQSEEVSARRDSGSLVAAATAKYEAARGVRTLLMPDKFREYLEKVYFHGWIPGTVPEHVSRHTVAHGVAPQERFDLKAAVIGILTVLQLGLYL